jgi:hypothetical protein
LAIISLFCLRSPGNDNTGRPEEEEEDKIRVSDFMMPFAE